MNNEFVNKGNAFWLVAILFTILAMMFGGCTGYTVEKSREDVDIVIYKEHHYIRFGLGDTAWGVHDPDCPNPIHKCN